MPSKLQEALFDEFQSVASDRGLSSVDSENTIASALERAAARVAPGQFTGQGQTGGGGASAMSSVTSIFTSGLGLAPLVSGLLGLFGGGDSTPPPLLKYAMPDKLYFQGTDIGSGIYSGDYDQMGTPRAYTNAQTSAGSVSAPASMASPVQVNVQAMDARSFLDHSAEIAAAVRQAMLNLNPINDVVNDL